MSSFDADAGALERDELDRLVFECLERIEIEGAAALEHVCAEHPAHADDLRARIRTLERAGLLGHAAGSTTDVPERLGDFRLLERIGAGGMGMVYLAEQAGLGRRVALKLIRPEQLYFPGARQRFAREVEAAARLAHPSIASIHTVGEASGVPYYAMELVDGRALSDAVARFASEDVERLAGRDLLEFLLASSSSASSSVSSASSSATSASATPSPGPSGAGSDSIPTLFAGDWTSTCLRIAREVAHALSHAHQRGVLHRDIKPSNVLVTAQGRVVLVDFGLASLQGSERLTSTGAQLGSLAYMAPEQARGDPRELGERTDVHALGVLLHELLTLRSPFLGATREVTMRNVLEGSAPRIRALRPSIARDVETVCATAMARDVERRYASAEELAVDLTNLLERRPVLARRAGAIERASLWARRHPAAASAWALGFLLVVVAPLVFAYQQATARDEIAAALDVARENERRATEAAEVAAHEARTADRTVEFFRALFNIQDPDVALGREFTVKQALEHGTDLIAGELDEEPGVKAQLMNSLALLNASLGYEIEAERLLEEAVPLIRETHGERSINVAVIELSLAESHHRRGRYDDAIAAALGVLARMGCVGRELEQRARAMYLLGQAQSDAGYVEDAEASLRDVIAMCSTSIEDGIELTCNAAGALAGVFASQERWEEALALFEPAVAAAEKLFGDEHSNTLAMRINHAQPLLMLGRVDEAEALMHATVPKLRTVYGATHPQTLVATENLAQLHIRRKRGAEAEALLEQVLEARRARHEENHPATWLALHKHARAKDLQGKHAEAEELFRRTIEGLKATLGEHYRDEWVCEYDLARNLQTQGRLDEAASWFERVIALAPPDDILHVRSRERLDELRKASSETP